MTAPSTTAGAPARAGVHPGIPDPGWDERLAALDGHFLQSRAWARCQQRMGAAAFHASDGGWMWLGIIQRVGPFRRLYLPYGPQVESAAALAAALRVATVCARRQSCHFVHFEPLSPQPLAPARLGARRVRPRQAEYTRIVDLDVEEAKLRSGLSKGHRSAISAAERKGVLIASASGGRALDEFLGMLRQTSDRTHFAVYPDWYYRAIVEELAPTGEATIYVAHHNERAIAAAIVLDFADTRYYAFASSASDAEARRLSPGPALVWRAMVDARTAGKRRFDFWGIAPPDQPDHPWSGFSAFKRSFGGEIVRRNGTWDLPVRPTVYAAWRLAQVLRR